MPSRADLPHMDWVPGLGAILALKPGAPRGEVLRRVALSNDTYCVDQPVIVNMEHGRTMDIVDFCHRLPSMTRGVEAECALVSWR